MKFLSVFLAIFLFNAGAHAQSDVPATSQEVVPMASSAWGYTTWPASTASPQDAHGTSVRILTLSQPKVSQKCHLRTITAGTITCRENLHRRTIVYHREDVAAIYLPGRYRFTNWIPIAVCLALSGGASFGVYTLASVSIAAALGGGIPLGLFAFGALLGIGFAAPDVPYDTVLYHRPNTPLGVYLHTPS